MPHHIEVDRTEIAYEEAGSGPAVVFSHAGIADRGMWHDQFADVAADHRVIAHDWRGYGRSGPAHGDYAHHLDLLALLEALAVERAVLVGSSMGGAYALDAALTSPERVTGPVLVCSGLSGHVWPAGMWDPLVEQVEATIPAGRLRAYQDGTAEQVLDADVAAMAMLRTVFRRRWREHPSVDQPAQPPAMTRLGEVTAPTLVVNGLEDVDAIQQVADLLTGSISGASRLDLPGTAHLPPLERPDLVTTAVRDHIARSTGEE